VGLGWFHTGVPASVSAQIENIREKTDWAALPT
jgi:hypothetical protein